MNRLVIAAICLVLQLLYLAGWAAYEASRLLPGAGVSIVVRTVPAHRDATWRRGDPRRGRCARRSGIRRGEILCSRRHRNPQRPRPDRAVARRRRSPSTD